MFPITNSYTHVEDILRVSILITDKLSLVAEFFSIMLTDSYTNYP